jgi:glycosyltransferase involved in cell wall biosynthesis
MWLQSSVLLVVWGDVHRWSMHDPSRARAYRTLGVFHEPPNRLAPRIADAPPGSVDAAICVSRVQLASLARVVRSDRLAFVPHGVNTDYFRPSAQSRDPNLVICVGSHLRDYRLLAETASILFRQRPGLEIRIIAREGMRACYQPAIDAGCRFVTGIPDTELRSSYQRAAVHLLPLTDATANNALLEGMACGTPTVVTDLPGVRDYIPCDAGLLCRGADAQSHAAGVLRLLEDASLCDAMSVAIRRAAEALDWRVVRPLLRQQLAAWGMAAPADECGGNTLAVEACPG